MNPFFSTSVKEEGKALYGALGPDVSALVQSYTPITVDIPFLNDVLQWHVDTIETKDNDYVFHVLRDALPKFRDPEHKAPHAFPDIDIMVKSLAFYRDRGYEIKEGKDFINMVINHPITTDVGRLSLHITMLDTSPIVMKPKDDPNITFSRLGKIYTINNWIRKESENRSIYTQDVLTLISFLLRRSGEFDARTRIREMKVDKVEYDISSVPFLNIYLTIDYYQS